MTNVIVKLEDGVGHLILNRPEQRNSLIGPLVVELKAGLDELVADKNCSAIIVSGAKGYFCAGLDLKAFSQDPAPDWKAGFQAAWADYHRSVYEANIPIIGALEGFAIAGGSSLALACDFLVVSESAFMHVSEVERNMLAPLNIFWLTQRHSYQTGLRMAVLGQRVYGPELVSSGLAELAVPAEEVVPTAQEMATRFASFDRANVEKLKSSLKQGKGQESFDTVLERIKSIATS